LYTAMSEKGILDFVSVIRVRSYEKGVDTRGGQLILVLSL